jgi:predicted NodU family carbamoyl transferase
VSGKILVVADPDHDGRIWGACAPDQRISRGAVHLHPLLGLVDARFGNFRLYHDAAAALVDEGRIIAAAQEERFTRKRHDAEFPAQAIAYCLEKAGYAIEDLDHVVFYDKPFLKFERLLETYVALAPRGFRSFKLAVPVWLREKLFQRSLLQKGT